jgi:hypothetical protein
VGPNWRPPQPLGDRTVYWHPGTIDHMMYLIDIFVVFSPILQANCCVQSCFVLRSWMTFYRRS